MKMIREAKLKPNTKSTQTSIYEIKIKSLAGDPIDLSIYKGKHILLVNVASKCGFTKQYDDLQILSDRYQDNLIVIGLPCNQFGNQEPGDASQIQSFCQKNFGVTFLLTEKVKVKGVQQHDLYTWLTQKERNGKKSFSVKWNFQKYLIDQNGELMDYFLPTTSPLSSKITKHFK